MRACDDTYNTTTRHRLLSLSLWCAYVMLHLIITWKGCCFFCFISFLARLLMYSYPIWFDLKITNQVYKLDPWFYFIFIIILVFYLVLILSLIWFWFGLWLGLWFGLWLGLFVYAHMTHMKDSIPAQDRHCHHMLWYSKFSLSSETKYCLNGHYQYIIRSLKLLYTHNSIIMVLRPLHYLVSASLTSLFVIVIAILFYYYSSKTPHCTHLTFLSRLCHKQDLVERVLDAEEREASLLTRKMKVSMTDKK